MVRIVDIPPGDRDGVFIESRFARTSSHVTDTDTTDLSLMDQHLDRNGRNLDTTTRSMKGRHRELENRYFTPVIVVGTLQ